MYKNNLIAIVLFFLLTSTHYTENKQTKKNIAIALLNKKNNSSEKKTDAGKTNFVTEKDSETEEPIIIKDEQGNLHIELHNKTVIKQTITIHLDNTAFDITETDEEVVVVATSSKKE